MKRCHFNGMDVHCQFCEVAVVTQAGKLVKRDRCATAIPQLVELLNTVPRPRALVFEEGPLADWLQRSLRLEVDELVVAEPRRNRLIAKDGDKDDDLDAEKLAQLLRGGYIKAVHHTDSLVRAVTLFVYLDTPWRFASKQALWKYLGIGLERKRSGNGPEYLGVPKRVNRPLKSTILGAAMSAVAHWASPWKVF